jgi:hypothetical protein
VIHLKSKFPTYENWNASTICSLPRNFIYINGKQASYADVFFWVKVDGEEKLVGIQA